jgi:hypothetical protein
MSWLVQSLVLTLLATNLGGCIIWPLKVSNELEVQVLDADTGAPIPHAQVVYIACDIHDFDCSHARVVRTTANERGEVDIESKRRFRIWVAAPGGLPVPNHFIAIWAPDHGAFVYCQYGDTIDRWKQYIDRQDIINVLNEVPSDQSSSGESLNPRTELIGGKIKLVKHK